MRALRFPATSGSTDVETQGNIPEERILNFSAEEIKYRVNWTGSEHSQILGFS